MTEYSQTEGLKRELQQNPNHVLVLPNGSAIAMLLGPEEQVYLIVAPDGVNFNNLTDAEVNQIIVNTLQQNSKGGS